MTETIEINRKEFEIIDHVGEHSYKGTRKGKTYFIKEFPMDMNDDYLKYIDCGSKLNASGIATPKIYTYDKRKFTIAVEWIDGENMLQVLANRDLKEEEYDQLFRTFWYARMDKRALDFHPDNFVFSKGKLFYLPMTYDKHDQKDEFLKNDLRLWTYTRELVIYLRGKSLPIDESRLKDEYNTNKTIALLVCKYYR